VAVNGRQRAGVAAIRSGAVTLAEAADAFLSSPRAAAPNTCRAYAGVLDRLAAGLGPDRQLAVVPGDEIAAALRPALGQARPGHVEPQPGRRRVLAALVRRQRSARQPACPGGPKRPFEVREFAGLKGRGGSGRRAPTRRSARP
jgi:hypothetical protein